MFFTVAPDKRAVLSRAAPEQFGRSTALIKTSHVRRGKSEFRRHTNKPLKKVFVGTLIYTFRRFLYTRNVSEVSVGNKLNRDGRSPLHACQLSSWSSDENEEGRGEENKRGIIVKS